MTPRLAPESAFGAAVAMDSEWAMTPPTVGRPALASAPNGLVAMFRRRREPAFRDAARSRPLRWYRSAGGIPAQFGGAQRPGRCTRSHGHSAASQAATASASGTSSSAWLARTHDWTVTSASGDSEG